MTISPKQQTVYSVAAFPLVGPYLIGRVRSPETHDPQQRATHTPKGNPMTWPIVYDNPYASPPPTYDSSVCGNCNGPTGRGGKLGWTTICGNCAETLSSFATDYHEEDFSDPRY